MNKVGKILVVAALAVVVAAVVVTKYSKSSMTTPAATAANAAGGSVNQPASQPQNQAAQPRMIDLGAGKCVACKAMTPIIDELQKTYARHFEVQFVDVWKNPEAGEKYHINMIPTQIFFDPLGKELFRHEGFFSREDILNKWKDLGYEFPLVATQNAPTEK